MAQGFQLTPDGQLQIPTGQEFVLPSTNNFQAAKANLILNGFGLNALQTRLFLLKDQTQDIAKYKSTFGLPIWDQLQLVGFTYQDPNGVDIIVGDGPGSILAIDTCLITVTQTKNIIETPIQGRPGPVFEYINDGAFIITLQGALTSNIPHTYPKDDMRKLISFMKAPSAIEVQCDYLRQFEITNLIVRDYEFPQNEGNRDMQFFRITCNSEWSFEVGKTIS